MVIGRYAQFGSLLHRLSSCSWSCVLICDAYYDSLKETSYEATSYDLADEGCLGA